MRTEEQIKELVRKLEWAQNVVGCSLEQIVRTAIKFADNNPIKEDVQLERFDVQDLSFEVDIRDGEKARLVRALEKAHGNRKQAANYVGMSERNFYRKIKEYNL